MTSTHTDPTFFPFEIINKDNLVPFENYYIQLNDKVMNKFIDKGGNVPVSSLKGKFLRLETESNIIQSMVYAVFNNVSIMNKTYKQGLCTLMLVRHPEGFLASAGGCDRYTDYNKGRIVNMNQEVYFAVNSWKFGKSTEQTLISNKALKKGVPSISYDQAGEINQYIGTAKKNKKGGRKTRTRNYKKHKKSRRSRHKKTNSKKN